MVKSNAYTTFQLRREYNYGSSGSSTEYDTFIDVPVTTSWTKFTHTYDAVDFSSKTIGSNNYYSIMFYWSTNQGSNKVRDGNIDITNVQIELGKVATPFEHRSYGEELALCQRYYYEAGVQPIDLVGVGHSSGYSGVTSGRITFPVTMRATPTYTRTVTQSNFSGTINTIQSPQAFRQISQNMTALQYHYQNYFKFTAEL